MYSQDSSKLTYNLASSYHKTGNLGLRQKNGSHEGEENISEVDVKSPLEAFRGEEREKIQINPRLYVN